MSAAVILSLALAASPSATEAIRQRDAEIRATLPPAGQKVDAAHREKAEEMLVKIVDFHGIAQSTLGKTWADAPEAKRKAFEDAFVKRFKQATSEQVDQYRTSQVTFGSETPAGENVKVSTTLGDGPDATEIIYLMAHRGPGWLIEDIVIDGVSTVDNYRKSFNRIISKDGLDALIAKLQKGPAATDGGAPASFDHPRKPAQGAKPAAKKPARPPAP